MASARRASTRRSAASAPPATKAWISGKEAASCLVGGGQSRLPWRRSARRWPRPSPADAATEPPDPNTAPPRAETKTGPVLAFPGADEDRRPRRRDPPSPPRGPPRPSPHRRRGHRRRSSESHKPSSAVVTARTESAREDVTRRNAHVAVFSRRSTRRTPNVPVKCGSCTRAPMRQPRPISALHLRFRVRCASRSRRSRRARVPRHSFARHARRIRLEARLHTHQPWPPCPPSPPSASVPPLPPRASRAPDAWALASPRRSRSAPPP